MKKITALLLSVLLLVSLASCRGSGAGTDGKEEILVWVAEEVLDFTKAQCASASSP